MSTDGISDDSYDDGDTNNNCGDGNYDSCGATDHGGSDAAADDDTIDSDNSDDDGGHDDDVIW